MSRMKRMIFISGVLATITMDARAGTLEIDLLNCNLQKQESLKSPDGTIPQRQRLFIKPNFSALIPKKEFVVFIDPNPAPPPTKLRQTYRKRITISKRKNQPWLASRQFRPVNEWTQRTKRPS